MKKLFLLLVVAMMAVGIKAQEQASRLVCDGNTYIYGGVEMSQSQMLDWYAQHNCQAAYDHFQKGLKMIRAGWTFLGIGAALDLGAITCGVIYLADVYSPKKAPAKARAYNIDPMQAAAVGLGVGALAFELACVPLLVVGYHKMHSSVNVYNVSCSTAQVRPYWTLQASGNGLGLAYKF